MYLDKLTQEQLELALRYLVDPKQKEPPPSLPELSQLEWLAVHCLLQELKDERRHSPLH